MDRMRLELSGLTGTVLFSGPAGTVVMSLASVLYVLV